MCLLVVFVVYTSNQICSNDRLVIPFITAATVLVASDNLYLSHSGQIFDIYNFLVHLAIMSYRPAIASMSLGVSSNPIYRNCTSLTTTSASMGPSAPREVRCRSSSWDSCHRDILRGSCVSRFQLSRRPDRIQSAPRRSRDPSSGRFIRSRDYGNWPVQ